MATDIENDTSYGQKPSSNHVTTSKTDNHSGSCRLKVLTLLQIFELALALTATMVGIYADVNYLPKGEVPIIIGSFTIVILPIEMYLQHCKPKKFNYRMTVGIVLLLLWAICPAAAIRYPKRNAPYYENEKYDNLYTHRHLFIVIITLSVIEVMLLLSQIVVGAHQMHIEKREKTNLADATQVHQITGNQGTESDVQAYGTSAQQPLCPPTSHEGTSIELQAAHPPGHRLRNFSPEALYQRSLQIIEADAGNCPKKQQVVNSQSQSSIAAARARTDSLQKPLDATNKPACSKIQRAPELANATSTKSPFPTVAPILARDPIDSPQKSTELDYELGNSHHNPVGSASKTASPPRITIEPASPITMSPVPAASFINATEGCGCVDGIEEVEIEALQNGKMPSVDGDIHPLRMNPNQMTRKFPLRVVESASEDWTPCG